MAQRTEKEETEFKAVHETITLCVNNCGVTGNPATNNMCQKCFNDTTATVSSSTGPRPATAAIVKPPHRFFAGRGDKTARSTSSRSPERPSNTVETSASRIRTSQDEAAVAAADGSQPAVAKREVNRCSGCRRKVGLTGFRCRCGELFCSEHRYSDRHDCSYDYKTAGREAIARENPLVKAAKIIRL